MIFLYSKLDIQNKGEGLGSLQDFVEEPIVTWNASGFLEVEFKYFLYGDLAEYMIPDAKLKTRIHSNDEVYHLFTIYEVEPDYIENTIQVRAEMTLLHELKDRVVPAGTMRGTANEMIMFVKNKMDRDYPFVITGTADKTVFIEHDNISAYELIFGEDGILKRTGAEIEFTDRGIRVFNRIGTIHRDELRESDFVTNLTVNELQGEDFVTRIIPFTTAMFDRPLRDGDRYTRETIETPTYGTPVISPNITNKLYKVRTKFVEYRNEPTEAVKYYNYQTDRGTETLEMNEYVYEDVTALNNDASTFFEDNQGIDEPTTTITIETLGLTKGYYTYLRYLNRYDIVTIYVEPKPYLTNTSETYVVQVNETVYEPLSDNLVSIGFTNESTSLEDAYRNVNEGRISDQQLQAELQKERLRDLEDRLVNYVYNHDGFRLEFGNVLPPPDEYREGDLYYLETGEGIDIYKLTNGAWEFLVGQSTREIIEGKFEELEPLLQGLSDEIVASEARATDKANQALQDAKDWAENLEDGLKIHASQITAGEIETARLKVTEIVSQGLSGNEESITQLVIGEDVFKSSVTNLTQQKVADELVQEYETVISKVNVINDGEGINSGEGIGEGRYFYFNSDDGVIERPLFRLTTYTLAFSTQTNHNNGNLITLEVRQYGGTEWEPVVTGQMIAGEQNTTITFDNDVFASTVADYRLAIQNVNGENVPYIWGFIIYEEVEVEIPIESENTGAISSQITQLYNMINLSILGQDGAMSRIAMGEEGIQIDGKLLHITAKTYIDDAVIKSAMIETLDAGKITTGELNANLIRVVNLDANSISGNEANFIRAMFSGTASSLQITSNGVNVLDNEGRSSTYLDSSGIEFSRQGVSLGKLEYVTNIADSGDLNNMHGFSMRPNRNSYFGVSYYKTINATSSTRVFAVSGRTGNVYISGLIKPSEQQPYGIDITWGYITGRDTNVRIYNHNRTGGIHIGNGDLSYLTSNGWRSLNSRLD